MNGKILIDYCFSFNFPGCFHPDYVKGGQSYKANVFLFLAKGLWKAKYVFQDLNNAFVSS